MIARPTGESIPRFLLGTASELVAVALRSLSHEMAGRVLIVDEEESILITMQAVLEQDGYLVTAASTGAVGSDLLQEVTFSTSPWSTSGRTTWTASR